MRAPGKLFLVTSLVALSLARQAGAASLQFVPLLVVLESGQQRGMIAIQNTGTDKVTVQLQMTKWVEDDHGQDVYQPTKDLIFYPQITTIEPGKESIVRVGYEGAVVPEVERTYRLFVQELPVQKPGTTSLQIALRVGLPIFLAAKVPAPKLGLESPAVDNGRLEIMVRNSGNTHAMVNTIAVTGLDESGATVFTREVKGWYVLAGIVRAFPLDVGPAEGSKARRLHIVVTAADASVEGSVDVDASLVALITEPPPVKKPDDNAPPPPPRP